jgi:hypothetical protein
MDGGMNEWMKTEGRRIENNGEIWVKREGMKVVNGARKEKGIEWTGSEMCKRVNIFMIYLFYDLYIFI